MRGRRPADLVRGQVLAAAGELLLAEGMGGFTIEKVAARAGASRMTIYKWWPSKGSLALDGYASVVRHSLEFPDTGDVEVDIAAQLLAFVHLVRDSRAGRVIRELVGAAQTDAELGLSFRERYSRPRRALAERILRTAVERGELRSDFDPQVVVDQLWGAVYNRLLIPDEPLTDEFARALVANILPGLRTRRDTVSTPAAIQAFVDATNSADTEAFVAAFTEDAFLDDWGRQFHGHDGVASWNKTDNIGVRAHFEIESIEPGGEPDSYTVTMKVRSHRFNGTGPMAIKVRGDKIASLVIS
ncbi:TetR/AcrR family transcriptional regulator C-terminal ligand-binding domain-containing protein [Kutzneria buriramensis]|uniref:AcrR family transcriptional regulator n=1 Tax=Kutzneria buriramensis TaxID=1045776 RepID=A0A3E0H0C6_9PSEU|nr:TetR/AcrR family transcriptional regulator C-terminal ligand-binding domain-containing protein [Kutzneria buriramensis]REH36307.1 AcrR family transcriptional regulator [Kutzneria buriramensis]